MVKLSYCCFLPLLVPFLPFSLCYVRTRHGHEAPTSKYTSANLGCVGMCRRNKYFHRCGHITYGMVTYCPESTISPRSGRRVMCKSKSRSHTVSNQADNLCGKSQCVLNKKGGVWICCHCGFGGAGSDRNRYKICSAGNCGHEVCSDCTPWRRG